MSDREKGIILEARSSLPEKDKQFVLGYAAGRVADVKQETETDQDQDAERQGA